MYTFEEYYQYVWVTEEKYKEDPIWIGLCFQEFIKPDTVPKKEIFIFNCTFYLKESLDFFFENYNHPDPGSSLYIDGVLTVLREEEEGGGEGERTRNE